MPAPQVLQCPSCASPIPAEALESTDEFITCAYCGSLTTLPGRRRGVPFQERPPLALPPGMAIQATPHGLVLTRRWFTWIVLFLIPFCLVWNGFLITWYSVALSTQAPAMALGFPLIHVGVGVFLTYYTLATLINRTRLSVERGELVIRHGPLPWFGYRRVPGILIDQLYCKAHVTQGKNGPHTQYQLWMIHTQGKHEKLHASSLSIEQALYIEQQIEKALGIRDCATPGELPRL
jgi:hypothetical protein